MAALRRIEAPRHDRPGPAPSEPESPRADVRARSRRQEVPMKRFVATVASLALVASSSAWAQQPDIAGRRLAPEDVGRVAPALEKYTQDRRYGEVWKRPGLSRRDRSIVTLAVL